MRLNTKQFKQMLSSAYDICGKKQIVPALSNAVIEVNADKLFIHAMNESVKIRLKYPDVVPSGNVKLLVSPKPIINYVSLIDDEEINLTFNNKSIKIAHERGSMLFGFSGMDGYPDLDEISSRRCIFKGDSNFVSCVRNLYEFVEKDMRRPVLTNVVLKHFGDSVCLYATDGRVVAREEVVPIAIIEENLKDEKVFFPRHIQSVLGRLENDKPITIEIGNRTYICQENIEISYLNNVGNPPNYDAVIPSDEEEKKLSFKCQDSYALLSAIKRLDDVEDILELEVVDGVKISRRQQDEDEVQLGSEHVDVEVEKQGAASIYAKGVLKILSAYSGAYLSNVSVSKQLIVFKLKNPATQGDVVAISILATPQTA